MTDEKEKIEEIKKIVKFDLAMAKELLNPKFFWEVESAYKF